MGCRVPVNALQRLSVGYRALGPEPSGAYRAVQEHRSLLLDGVDRQADALRLSQQACGGEVPGHVMRCGGQVGQGGINLVSSGQLARDGPHPLDMVRQPGWKGCKPLVQQGRELEGHQPMPPS